MRCRAALRQTGGPIHIGTYVFAEQERNGFERTLILVAQAADHAEPLKEPKRRAWEEQAFGDITATIAKEHGLKLSITDALNRHLIPYGPKKATSPF